MQCLKCDRSVKEDLWSYRILLEKNQVCVQDFRIKLEEKVYNHDELKALGFKETTVTVARSAMFAQFYTKDTHLGNGHLMKYQKI